LAGGELVDGRNLAHHAARLAGAAPFRKVDFADPRIRQGLTDFIPDLDLDDAETVDMLRQVVVPTQYVQDVLNIGRGARLAAPRLELPTLIIQGKRDPVITPRA
jgi:pimeloyl-ACP methyl ester carboxylesterase